MLQCRCDADAQDTSAYCLISSNRMIIAAHIDPQLIPVVHQLLSAAVHHCCGVKRRWLISQVRAIVCACLQPTHTVSQQDSDRTLA